MKTSVSTGNQPIDNVLSRLDRVVSKGDGWEAECPCHNDGKNSLCIGVGNDERVLLRCQAGCETSDIVEAMGIKMSDLFAKNNKPSNGKPRIVATYDYCDEDGKVLYQSLRYKPKTFKQRASDGNGGWLWKMNGVQRVLYRLPELIQADPARCVIVVEGEKDADRLVAAGFVAVCNVGGAGKWKPGYNDHLARRRVAVIGDNDDAGKKHAQQVAASLQGKAASIKIVELPNLPEKGDVSDWLDSGHTVDELKGIISDAPEWAPEEFTAPKPDNGHTPNSRTRKPDADDGMVRNAIIEGGKLQPLPIGNIIERIKNLTNDWPRRVGSALFVHEGNRIDWIEKPASLFGFIGSRAGKPPKFLPDAGCHTKSEVHAELQRTATTYEAVEELPHEPKLPGHFYACPFPVAGDGSKLRGLVERFNPETPIDADLITTLFVSVFWGGTGGTKPAYLITADAGRGVGKSTLGSMAGYLGNGHIELSANENAETLKQRLLSPEGITRRVAMLDNVKSLRFSWSDLEAMITAPFISGKRLYVGEARRPNNLVWIITLNGASLATDLAQRCCIIKLKRPEHSGNWLEETRDYIDDNRQAIIGDIIGFLRSERRELRQHSRWGAWERDILSRLPEPAEAQAVILERQGAANVEHEESEIIEQCLVERLESLRYDSATDVVFLPSNRLSRWMSDVMNDRINTLAASRMLKQKIDEGEIQRLAVNPSRTHGRGFLWVGKEANHETATFYDLEHRVEMQNQGALR